MRKKIIFLMSIIILLHFSFYSTYGSSKKVLALGKYDFYHYFTYDELTNFLKDLNKAYPNITELKSLCKSDMGRDVWLLIINNPKTGKAEEKPGFFMNQIHAGEVIAAASNCYTAWYLLDNYGKDDYVTKIVDNLVWYIVPRLDVDGAEAYLTGKPSGKDPNPIDDDKDFKFNEDPPEDLDGDGFIVQMRKKDPRGEWKISKEDPRIMVRKVKDELEGTVYKIYSEGIDNDGDGKINEDSFTPAGGRLSNRNYPGNWQPQITQGGAKLYPMQEVVTRAEVDFVASHPNIAIYNQSHCCGRVILRPPTTATDVAFKFRSDLELFQVATARMVERSGWELGTSVFEWRYPPGTPDKKPTQVWRDKDGKLKNTPWEASEDASSEYASSLCGGCEDEYQYDRGYFAWGSSLETMYNIFGIFAFADEHWRHPDYDKDGKITEKERLKWNDEEMGGKIFVDWHSYDHPTLGQVEIGGWRRRKVSPPEGELIQKECEMGKNYKIYLGGQAPELRIKATLKAIDKKARIYQVDIEVENNGFLPTALQQAQYLKIAEPCVLEVQPDSNEEIMFGKKKVKIGHIDGNSVSKIVTYVVRLKTKKGALKAVVTSQRAGKDTKDIIIQ